METKLTVKNWMVATIKGDKVVTGEYAIMFDGKEIAAEKFNGEYGGTPINFEREIMDKVKEVTDSIEKSIQSSFTK